MGLRRGEGGWGRTSEPGKGLCCCGEAGAADPGPERGVPQVRGLGGSSSATVLRRAVAGLRGEPGSWWSWGGRERPSCLPLTSRLRPGTSVPPSPPAQSLLELHKRRKALTEPEARYYLRQVVLGCQYLHRNRVIHRDLKLGNLFLNEDLEVKIGEELGLRGLDTRREGAWGGREEGGGQPAGDGLWKGHCPECSVRSTPGEAWSPRPARPFI